MIKHLLKNEVEKKENAQDGRDPLLDFLGQLKNY